SARPRPPRLRPTLLGAPAAPHLLVPAHTTRPRRAALPTRPRVQNQHLRRTMGPMAHDDDDLIDATEASELLDVQPDRLAVMVEEDLLTPIEGGSSTAWRFRRAEVLAVKLSGG
ncbi:hypothetical protein B7486_78440, partial [cyanobacterium TDX16]